MIIKFAFVFLASLFLSVTGPQTVEAQTRTIRHPEAGSPALTVDVPDGWTSTIDDSNNLILASPTRTVPTRSSGRSTHAGRSSAGSASRG